MYFSRMRVIIRPEQPTDYSEIARLLKAAFSEHEYSEQPAHLLVERLRKSRAYSPDLALVAESGQRLLGYVLLVPVSLADEASDVSLLAMAPLAVDPSCQRQGIGALLMQKAQERAKSQGCSAIILVGDPAFYTKLGYELMRFFQLELPFKVPEAHCMVQVLNKEKLKDLKGRVVYPAAFFP